MNERPFAEQEFPALAAVLAADEERLLGRPSRLGTNDFAAWVSGVDLVRHSLVVEDEAGIRALAWVESHGPVGVAVVAVGGGDGLDDVGGRLVEWSEALIRQTSSARIHQVALAADASLNTLLVSRGYHEARRFWGMAIELAGALPEPEIPAGLRIEAFEETAAPAFYGALDEAFRDHWEHHPQPFAAWWEEKRSAPNFDPTLWFLIRDGDEIAAAVRNEPNRNGGGWVAALGVRRLWRGRGLGRALLLHSFREFGRRGFARASLGVDSESPTGATRLYESVGMYVEDEQIVWEKQLA